MKAYYKIIKWNKTINEFMNCADMNDNWMKYFWEEEIIVISYNTKLTLEKAHSLINIIIEWYKKVSEEIVYCDLLYLEDDNIIIKNIKLKPFKEKWIKMISNWKIYKIIN